MNVATNIATSIVWFFFWWARFDLWAYATQMKGEGKWELNLMQWTFLKNKRCFGRKEKYTYAIEAIGEVIDARDPIVDVTFWHDCFCVHATAFFNVWLHILCPPYK